MDTNSEISQTRGVQYFHYIEVFNFKIIYFIEKSDFNLKKKIKKNMQINRNYPQ